jgi:tetratricopeptide (TPR) repeat protein
MALRITSATLPQPEAPQQDLATLELAIAKRLSDRAAALLAHGEVKGYLELFATASELPHEVRRLFAYELLIHQGLQAIRQADERSATHTLLAMAHGITAVLEKYPSEPLLLNYAGVIFYELWALDAARELFAAARRLDPVPPPHLAENVAALKRRTRQASVAKRRTHRALIGVAARAKAAAARAHSTPGLKLSLCMIVKDEEEMLPRCLEAVAPAVDEMVIVDTGSSDRTIEIARSFGARVIEHPWTGDFSEARNISLEAATGDWFLYLDADEVLVPEDAAKIRDLLGRTWREAFFVNETNFTGREEHGSAVTHSTLRIFRNRPEYRFTGRLHEQIADKLPTFASERMAQSTIRVDHFGYLGVVRDARGKSRRNIEILEQQRNEHAPTAFFHFNLGSEYLVAGESEKGVEEFEQAWRLIRRESLVPEAFGATLALRTMMALCAVGRHQEAITRADAWLETFPGFTDLVYEQGQAALGLGREGDAIAYFKRCIEMGDATGGYTAWVGTGTYLPRINIAIRCLLKGETEPAVELLRWCADNHPRFFGIIHPYATALLRSGMAPDAVVAEIETKILDVTPTVRFMLGAALYEAGAAPQAETQFRQVLARRPDSDGAKSALAEALLYQRRYTESAAVGATVSNASDKAVGAARSQVFALLLAGDAEGAASALRRGATVGVDPAELTLFRAWHERLVRADLQTSIPNAALPLLDVILDALLRVQDFKNFEFVVGLLADVEGQSERQRRERLALIYLKRGFIKSAAREWLTVYKQKPDLPALLGLAEVAQRAGQPQNAVTFAQQALRLDPGNARAHAILKNLAAAAAA